MLQKEFDHCLMEKQQSLWIAWGLLVPLHVLLLAWLACCSSPTSDEIAHLAAGVRIWNSGDFSLYSVNPPLVKVVAALPVVLDMPGSNWSHLESTPGARPEWIVGQDYIKANRSRFRWDFVVARCACLPFSVLGMMTCFYWANDLFGPRGGVLAALLWCFSPDILGNGALITPDVPAAALGIATLFQFRQWLQSGRWSNAVFTGVLLGLTELSKMTWLPLYALLPMIWCWTVWARRKKNELRSLHAPLQAAQLICVLFISLDILNAGYRFQQTFRPLGEFSFVSRLLAGRGDPALPGNRFADTWLGKFPVPLPADYLRGFDLQRRDFEGHWKPLVSYLHGELRSTGWWHYYLSCMLIKIPMGTWIVAACAAFASWQRRKAGPPLGLIDKATLFVPPLVIFLLVSSQIGFSRYFRYLLPCFPFAMILCGAAWSRNLQSPFRWRTWLAGIGVAMSIGSSLLVYPHSLSYFNLLAGGPANGHWHLLDSNVDWGQDLYFLKDWIRQHPEATPLTLSYSGVADPNDFEINFETIHAVQKEHGRPLSPGWYAISVNHLHGYDDAPAVCAEFLHRQPVARAGYSILIYHLEQGVIE